MTKDARKNAILGYKYPFWAKKQNCQLRLVKFGTKTSSNMHNLVVAFTFSVFRLEIPFLGKFFPKNQNCYFKLKFST